MDIRFSWGDIVYADLAPVIGSEQGGIRPVVIVQNNTGNKFAPTTIIVPVTTADKKKNMPTHIYIPPRDGLREPSQIVCEQIRTVDKIRLREKIGVLTIPEREKLMRAIAIAVRNR